MAAAIRKSRVKDSLFTNPHWSGLLAEVGRCGYIAAMKAKDAVILFVAGDTKISSGHWQARWQGRLSTGRQLVPGQAELADAQKWSKKVADAINESTVPVVIVAHGLGVTAAIHAASHFTADVAGAFLVAPADPSVATSRANDNGRFGPYPRGPLAYPSLLVASRDDPACEYHVAEELAADWGAQFMDAGAVGGIDEASEFGPWPEGLMTFAKFISQLKSEPKPTD